jgi:EAL domain-containing protein (putative c-di-GMP-specific phosphodiesterase class I)
VSIGVACAADSHGVAEDLLREADLALYRAKDQGRNRAEIFDDDLRTRAVARLVTERMLRRAIGEQRLIVEYQPVIDLRSGEVVGAEALVRVRDAESELILPGSFLQVAMETGLMMALDKLLLADAVHQAEAWHHRLGDTSFREVAINLCARHLADAGFTRYVIDQLDAHSVPYHRLQIEVTEQVLMEASNSAMSALRALRDAGVQVGLDDFGTGYSSLSYLRTLPLDFVKIDRTLVSEVDRDAGGKAMAAAIIDLAHGLGLLVVAEGVETPRQLRTLQELGCDRAQGFLIAPSTAPYAVDAFVRAGPRSAVLVGDA